jgi:gamma-glutamyl-gamma-aminobutyrate hydrolase PuuD
MNIGLSQRVLKFRGRPYDSIEHCWYQYLKGHEITLIPNILEQDFSALANHLDCLIITGGDNRLIRRATEEKLASEMILQNKPILGICHGCFLLTERLGGTISKKDGHRNGVHHTVTYRNQDIMVNSYHGLYIKLPHSSAKVLAVDSDGDCEAWIDGMIAGVVWHPERMSVPFLPKEIHKLIFKH